jgi:hypothetical protein
MLAFAEQNRRKEEFHTVRREFKKYAQRSF